METLGVTYASCVARSARTRRLDIGHGGPDGPRAPDQPDGLTPDLRVGQREAVGEAPAVPLGSRGRAAGP